MGTTRLRLRCPTCGAEDKSASPADAVLVKSATRSALDCSVCSVSYAIVDDIPHLHRDDHTWLTKERESQGWETFAAELGQLHYEGVGAPPVDFVIPYIPDEPWATFAKSFDRIVEGIDLEGKLVLDIGAGRPWAAKQFAKRGAIAAAMDVNAHLVVGLGRGLEMMREAGVTLDLLVGDSEQIPLASDQFDIVFISAAMHHTNFLRRLAREMARVTKPGGLVLIANEPTRAGSEDEADLLLEVAEMELRHGITERRPSTAEYLVALRAAGLTVTDLRLGPDCESPAALHGRLAVTALVPARRTWLTKAGARRTAGALRNRFRNMSSEIELRRVLPRKSTGVRKSHAQMMCVTHGRPDINIRARKSQD